MRLRLLFTLTDTLTAMALASFDLCCRLSVCVFANKLYDTELGATFE